MHRCKKKHKFKRFIHVIQYVIQVKNAFFELLVNGVSVVHRLSLSLTYCPEILKYYWKGRKIAKHSSIHLTARIIFSPRLCFLQVPGLKIYGLFAVDDRDVSEQNLVKYIVYYNDVCARKYSLTLTAPPPHPHPSKKIINK